MARSRRASASAEVDGRQWLEEALEGDLSAEGAAKALAKAARKQPPALAVSILRAAVEQMPALRRDTGRDARLRGTALYEIAAALYSKRLPVTEEDVVALLESSRHDCGHGVDVLPPMDLALSHAGEHGVSHNLARTVESYAAALKGVSSVKAQNAKRKAAFVSLLRGEHELPEGSCRWAGRLWAAVVALGAQEREAWSRFIRSMDVTDSMKLSRKTRSRHEAFVDALGAAAVLGFLEGCWPKGEDEGQLQIETAESHVLKNLLWLLGVIAERCPHEAHRADALVASLAEVQLEPAGVADKLAGSAARYFAARPPELALEPLRRLEAWDARRLGRSEASRLADARAKCEAALGGEAAPTGEPAL